MAERIGFPAVYLSGGALSAGWAGVPDIGLLTLSEFAQAASVLASATSLPLLCDADTGFGEAVNVERTVELIERGRRGGLAPRRPGLAEAVRAPLGQGADRDPGDGREGPRGGRRPGATPTS